MRSSTRLSGGLRLCCNRLVEVFRLRKRSKGIAVFRQNPPEGTGFGAEAPCLSVATFALRVAVVIASARPQGSRLRVLPFSSLASAPPDAPCEAWAVRVFASCRAFPCRFRTASSVPCPPFGCALRCIGVFDRASLRLPSDRISRCPSALCRMLSRSTLSFLFSLPLLRTRRAGCFARNPRPFLTTSVTVLQSQVSTRMMRLPT